MFRRKPPQLSLYEELQQTYNDVCENSIKNLTLEEDNKFEEALKGWKGLHTSLLFKCDVFEKQASKLTSDERGILQDLKNIRDENVKHLIRVQLRIDEKVRRTSKPQLQPQSSSSSSNNAHNLTVHSLRQSSGSNGRTINSTNNSRSMLKSLRPGGSTGGSVSGSSHAHKKAPVASQTAANVSWQKPKKTSPPVSSINFVTSTPQDDEDELFDDFDQESFEFTDSNWERVDSIESANSHNLIDLDDGIGPTAPSINEPQNGHYFVTNQSLSTSLDELTLKPKSTKNGLTPPPPPPRNRSYNNPPISKENPASKSNDSLKHPASKSNDNRNDNPKPSASNYLSKSTPDVTEKPSPVKKKYVYKQPKPININHLMNPNQPTKKKTSSSTIPTVKKTVQPSSQPASQSSQSKARAKPNAANFKNSNISYNYKVIPKPGAKPVATKKQQPVQAKPAAKQAIDSPTMDDILNGYDDRFNDELVGNDDDADVDTEVAGEHMTEAQQDELIKSIRGIDVTAAKQILNDIVVQGDEVYWDDIVGLDGAKNSLKEAVVYPFLRPDLFRGLREPTRGMLLFGPPGTGKTMLARAVATESKSTFFSISSSSLTSKYLGESEKLVKALFLLAKKLSPSIVFMDEIDSLLSSRSEGEVESSRRIKNEFLVQWSELSSAAAGRTSSGNKEDVEDVSRVLILGATNLPWSIDEAARRRFVKRQYIPLPEDETRKAQIIKLLSYQKHTLSDDDFNELISLTKGFSGSDITALAKDSAMGPLRSLGDKLLTTPTEQIRPINLDDFVQSLKYIRPSVSSEGLEEYEKWASKFGSSGV